MNKIKNVILSYWYEEMNFHPNDKINELQDAMKGIIDAPLMYNEEDIHHLISLPRIKGISQNHQYAFQISLINAFLSCDVSDLETDEIILLVNNHLQYLHDVLKNLFNLRICYTSIKVEIMEEVDNSSNVLGKRYEIDEELEDFSIRRGYQKDDYYINYLINAGKEYNFNVKREKDDLEQDIFDRTMITSLSLAEKKREFIMKVVEINDRQAFNNNSNYETTMDNLRGMIIELKNILNNELYDKK